ncbi:hypothetical protein GCM10009554_11160 [Kribbella koreensis]|uniref:Uncharacterized protein n=1 Tax=Kribbella koreensis TaxID=57909 RepID=A0ABN1PJ78_9ACTN
MNHRLRPSAAIAPATPTPPSAAIPGVLNEAGAPAPRETHVLRRPPNEAAPPVGAVRPNRHPITRRPSTTGSDV